MADVFKDRLDESRTLLQGQGLGDKIEVTDERCFCGLDAFEKLLALKDVNYVHLWPPRRASVRSTSKLPSRLASTCLRKSLSPLMVPALRTCLTAAEEAKVQRHLAIGAGTQNRHKTGYIETMKLVHEGAIGEILAARCYFNTGGIWVKPRQPEWTDMEWQLRNWYYFTYLSGDHIVEQHVHQLDAINWAMNAHPIRATSFGRQTGANRSGLWSYLRPLHR
ncbi:MAG: hypothetical protein WKF84_08520 [Pyrinomonadaceae bacterium]